MNPAGLATHFPVESQTSDADKAFLLGAMSVMRQSRETYDYLEIGSFLGGTLAPFLRDPACRAVVSIDDRGRIQPDERGAAYDYGGVTTAAMLDRLKAAGLDTAKLQTFDGSVEAWTPGDTRFDMALVDGEHTDVACFRDSLWALPVMNDSSLLLFHDSTLIYKAIRLLLVYLQKQRIGFRFWKRKDSEMSCLAFGALVAQDLEPALGPMQDPMAFFAQAELQVLDMQIRNRVEINYTIRKPPVYKMT